MPQRARAEPRIRGPALDSDAPAGAPEGTVKVGAIDQASDEKIARTDGWYAGITADIFG